MILLLGSGRRLCAHRSRVRSSMSTETRAASRSIRGKRRQNCVRPPRSMAMRCTRKAQRRMRKKSQSGASPILSPTNAALAAEIARLRVAHGRVALFDAHSIRSRIPRLFDGELPLFNLGANDGRACSPSLRDRLGNIFAESGQSFVVDGRFKGGWITRSLGRPASGVEAVQMEMGCRAYMVEPETIGPDNWPTPLDPSRAENTRRILRAVLESLLEFVGVR